MNIEAILGEVKSTVRSVGTMLADTMFDIKIREDGVLRNSSERLSDDEKTFLLHVLNMSSAMVDITDYGFIIGKNSVSMNTATNLTMLANSKITLKMNTSRLIHKIQYTDVKNYEMPIFWYVKVNGHTIKKKSQFKYSDVIYSK